MAVDPHHRRHADRQMQVGCLVLDHFPEDLAYIHVLSLPSVCSVPASHDDPGDLFDAGHALQHPLEAVLRAATIMPSARATRPISSALLRSTMSLSMASVTGMIS